MNFILMDAVASTFSGFPVAFTLVYIVGFIAAVVIGSVAWYNSKRPPGWEGADRPNLIPDLKTDEENRSSDQS
jgi:hypothetical protein